jgi:hypothetical protein
MEKEIPGWKATSCSLGKTNELQLRKMDCDEEDAGILRGLRVFVVT